MRGSSFDIRAGFSLPRYMAEPGHCPRGFWGGSFVRDAVFLAFWVVLAMLLPSHAAAQPSLGQRLTDALETEVGYRIPLPPGTWEVKAMKTEEQPGSITRHLVLENEIAARADFPFVVVRYVTRHTSERWQDICAAQDGSIWRSRHGSEPGQPLQKCERIWLEPLPAEGQPTRSKWAWSKLYPAFNVYPRLMFLPLQNFVRSNLAVAVDGGPWVMVEVFANLGKTGLGDTVIRDAIRRNQPIEWTSDFMRWSADFVQALKSSAIDRRSVAIAGMGPAPGPPDLAPPDGPAALSATDAAPPPSNNPTEIRLAAAEEARRKAAQEVTRIAEEARQQQAAREQLQAEVQRLRAELDQQRKPADLSSQANRKALVIGNDSYRHIARLTTAREDAKAVGNMLTRAGFTVTTRLDLGEKEMRSVLRQFAAQIQGGDEVVFFYAGHGVQLSGTNFLVPVDVPGENEAQLRDDSVPLQRVLDDMTDRKAKLTVAIIDACRDNPFQSAGRSLGGAARGLAATTAATGQMIIFSAGSGQRALDNLGPSDKSPNGVFTRVFVQEMSRRGVSLDRMVRNTRGEVVRLAQSIGHEQVPAIYDQIIGDFYLAK